MALSASSEGPVPVSTGDVDRAALVTVIVEEGQIAILEEEGAGESLGVVERGAALWDHIHMKWSADLALRRQRRRQDGLGVTCNLFDGMPLGCDDARYSAINFCEGWSRLASRGLGLVAASMFHPILATLAVTVAVALLVFSVGALTPRMGISVAALLLTPALVGIAILTALRQGYPSARADDAPSADR